MMPISSPLLTITPWTFSVYVADRDTIQTALPHATEPFRSVVYLHGYTGTRLLKLHAHRAIKLLQASGYEDLITHISNTKGDLLLIEYCEEWFLDNPHRIARFGEECKEYSRKKGTIVLLSVRLNYVIRALEPFIGPVIPLHQVQIPSQHVLPQTPLFVNENREILSYGQQTLQL
ncbi:hypothetical protein KHC33_14805 [Methanospirillum sp. J.3.6.1-F.2.7.3]|uniref:Uncharacterized protein n=1 Tax=Methanospirillum purgamenti TaxID=2834276 RepID=A0A8E7EGU9_9EURY|nr:MULTISPECIES: hypothetical protein [Methanospirillum]MDX8548882.1 hypothetical protein [Methanospirillum hungatei]QVV88573.1 hypothetical protein KHC33_14805 [Methanospirillum sp. J.3.6.1-F.2.7.3]